MSNQKIAGLSAHLAPLLEPAPSGVFKVVAALDGLNTESQVFLMGKLGAGRTSMRHLVLPTSGGKKGKHIRCNQSRYREVKVSWCTMSGKH